jgi:tRNA A37 methylthiotransferase MiaB
VKRRRKTLTGEQNAVTVEKRKTLIGKQNAAIVEERERRESY